MNVQQAIKAWQQALCQALNSRNSETIKQVADEVEKEMDDWVLRNAPELYMEEQDMANHTPSLREKIKIYKSSLNSEQLAEFNRVFDDLKESKQLQKAFVAAKEAAEKIRKLAQ